MRGGKRPGAGRPPKYNEPTVHLQVPLSLVKAVKELIEKKIKDPKPGKGKMR